MARTNLEGALVRNVRFGPAAAGATDATGGAGGMLQIPSQTVAAAGSVQSDAAALATGFNQVTAADGTKGVRLPSAQAGMVVIIKTTTGSILKVWPGVGDQINAVAVDSAFSTAAAAVCFILVAFDATTWYTIPLLPS